MASDVSSATRLALVGLGVAVFFASASLAESLRRDARASARQQQVDAKLDVLIELERQQLDELRALRETRKAGDDVTAA